MFILMSLRCDFLFSIRHPTVKISPVKILKIVLWSSRVAKKYIFLWQLSIKWQEGGRQPFPQPVWICNESFQSARPLFDKLRCQRESFKSNSSFFKTSGIPIYGSVTSSAGMITSVTCQGMSFLATLRVLLVTRVVISKSCFIPSLKIFLVSSDKVSLLPSVSFRLDGGPARLFTVN